MIVEILQKYIEYTPAKAVYDKVVVDVQEVVEEGYTSTHKQSVKTPTKAAAGLMVVMLVAALIGLLIFVLNIVGICVQFKCKQVTLGVVSIVGLLFGLPIGTIYYLVYLFHPDVCQM